MLSLGAVQNTTLPEPFAENRQRIVGMPQQCQRADELSAALGVRHVL